MGLKVFPFSFKVIMNRETRYNMILTPAEFNSVMALRKNARVFKDFGYIQLAIFDARRNILLKQFVYNRDEEQDC